MAKNNEPLIGYSSPSANTGGLRLSHSSERAGSSLKLSIGNFFTLCPSTASFNAISHNNVFKQIKTQLKTPMPGSALLANFDS
jgi:hypothetical protein